MEPNLTYKFLHSKGRKRQWMEWDKIIPNDATNKGLFSKLYKKKKKLIQLKNNKKQTTQLKKDQKTSTDISQR